MKREWSGLLVACAVVLLAAGCGGDIGGLGAAGKSTIPECGFVMTLPPGWTTEDYAETEFYKRGDRENSWGMAKFCPLWTLDQRTLSTRKFEGVSEFAKYVIEEERFDGALAEVVSQRPLKVGEVQADAYEIIFRDNDGNCCFTVFIEMDGGQALQVFFMVPGGACEKFNKQYADAVNSIQLASKRMDWGKAE